MLSDQLDIYRRTNNAREEAGQNSSAGDSPTVMPEILRFGVAKINDNSSQNGTYTVTEQWRNPQTAQWDDALAPAGCVQAGARDFLDSSDGKADQLVPFWRQRAKGGEIEILVNVSATIPNGVSGDILYNNGSKWVVLNKSDNGKLLKLYGGLPMWGDAPDGLPEGVSGDVIYHNSTEWVKLSKGSDGQVLQLDGGLPSWAGNTLYDGWNKGDVLYWNGTVWQILPIGTDKQRLAVDTDIPGWVDAELPAGATGSILYHNGTNWVVLPIGTSSQILHAEGGTISWFQPHLPGPGWADGQITYWNTMFSNWSILNLGATDEVLTVVSGQLSWAAPSGGLPSSSGKSQYMVLQLDGSLDAQWDWTRAHG